MTENEKKLIDAMAEIKKETKEFREFSKGWLKKLEERVKDLEWRREIDNTYLRALYMSKEDLLHEYVGACIVIGHGYEDELDTQISAYGGELIRRQEMFGKGYTADQLDTEAEKAEADINRQSQLEKEIRAVKKQYGNDYRVELNVEQKLQDDNIIAHLASIEARRIATEEAKRNPGDIDW